ncbi:hypothetical protein D934_13380 [Xylella fastidiosa subsp. sandyi Ann-1]|uniref:Uncharacterized protein n=1 Tax=Xylella fastidiosa subsp. sandyi Ann-1 TaxID=155920 RepID=A0A060H4H9_XYLFS|nr:hypothetical protein D934_13380 [Xylella fastidiosa subsp. sandyi Ann-1]
MDIAPCPPFLKTQHQTFEFCNTQATVAIEPEARCMTMENIAHLLHLQNLHDALIAYQVWTRS